MNLKLELLKILSYRMMIIFIVCCSGCIRLPPLNGVVIDNKSDNEIYVYTVNPFVGEIIYPNASKYLQCENSFFYIYSPLSEITKEYKIIEDGYSLGNYFWHGNGRYKYFIWKKEMTLLDATNKSMK